MRATLTASTGKKILVWREGDVFATREADAVQEAQICLGVDLFEVIAELAGLKLDDQIQAEEASRLAAQAVGELAQAAPGDGHPSSDGHHPHFQDRHRSESSEGG